MTYDPNLSRDLIRDTDSYGPAISHAERALRNQLQLADDEIKRLSEWRRQQLAVVAWWSTIDDYVRKHAEAKLGDSVSATALKLIQERDTFKAALVNAEERLSKVPTWCPRCEADLTLNIGGI